VPIRNAPRTAVFISLGLIAMVVALYAPAARFDFLNYDDPDYVANAHVIQGLTMANVAWAFTSGSAANWFPLTWISHMIDRSLFGGAAGLHHLMNVALHALATVLLFAAMKRMTGAIWRSAFVALIFAVHPLHIESVAWVAERKDVLSAVFFFATIWAYVYYVERPSAARYGMVTLALCCALMSKPTTVTLPIVLVLLDEWPLKRDRAWLEKIPWFALAAAASVVTYVVQQNAGAVLAEEIPIALRLENAIVSYAVYLLKFFAPANLAVFYPYPASIPTSEFIGAGALLVTISGAIFKLHRRYLIVGWLWFVVTLLPMIGLIQVGLQSRADRYTYLPFTGLAIMLAWGVAELFAKRIAPAAVAASIGLIVVTFINLQNWRDSIALFRHAISVTEGNYIAYNNLGIALRRGGHVEESIPLFQSAIDAHPANAEAQDNLGEALLVENKFEEAAPHIGEALRLNPELAEAHINMGALLNKRGHYAEAAEQYRTALRLDPDNADAHAGLGVTLTELSRFDEALPQLIEASRAKPESADVHYNLGRLYGLAGRAADAIAEFNEAIRIDPANSEARFNLGTALASANRLPEAEDQFRAVVRLKPDYLNAHFNLASALASEGRYDDAIPEFSEVLRLNPNFQGARRALEYCRELRRR
jgi:protein O-mannosyl-transferase